jgi:hypothetical protein
MIIANPFTGQVLNANPEGHNQYVNPDGPGNYRKLSRLIDKLRTTHYEDPSTGELKKVKSRSVGLGSLSREALLRLAGDEYGIETDDMKPYGVNPEDTEAIRRYVKEYARTYAGHELT